MSGLALGAMLQVSLLVTGADYGEARQAAVASNQPLVVLVGAEWCPACRTMKQSVLPRLRNRGLLNRVNFAQVDTDSHPVLSRRLMSGSSIPQLVMYYRTDTGWQRKEVIGARSEAEIEAFIDAGVKLASDRKEITADEVTSAE